MYLAGRTKREANSMHPKNHGQVIPNADTLAFFEAEEAKVAERARIMADKIKASNAAFKSQFPELDKPSDPCADYLTTKEKCKNKCPGFDSWWKCGSAGGRRTRKQNHRNKHKTRKQSRRRYRRD
jgi:hypothetical protein